MRHPSDGLLRRAVDEPAAVSDADRHHIAGCPRCRQELRAAGADRELVAAALQEGPPAGPDDVDAAWSRMVNHVDDVRDIKIPMLARRSRWVSVRRPVVVVAAAAVVAVGTTAAAAAVDLLPIFRPDRVASLTIQTADLASMPDLSAYGTVSETQNWQPEAASSAAEATVRTGIDVPKVMTLPQGVVGAPRYAVLSTYEGRFTFSAEMARVAAERAGQTAPPMPAGVDGTVLTLNAGPGVVETWTGGSVEIPKLTVVRMTAPSLSSQGASLVTLRDYLLEQPGLPSSVADQIRAIPADGSTLPIPVPAEYATSRSTTVNGETATLVTLRDGSAAGVVWIANGQLNAVFGTLSPEDAEAVARGLR